jgi:hypothetical protein
MPNLQTDIRQLFSQTVLRRFERIDEAEVQFTFDEGDVYMSVFSEAMSHLAVTGFSERDDQLAGYARVFERYLTAPFGSVSSSLAGTIASSLFWLSGYSANAFLMASAVLSRQEALTGARPLLLRFLSRQMFRGEDGFEVAPLMQQLRTYVRSGDENALLQAIDSARQLETAALNGNGAEEFVTAQLLSKVVARFAYVSAWASITGRSSASQDQWRRYMEVQAAMRLPLVDLWPSQRNAIAKGLLDGHSSLTLRMPTSAGKTKLTELAFANDLMTDEHRRCLYLAPFRALVSEVETQIGEPLSKLGFSVASLYGGSDANFLEARLAEIARVVVATPEKIDAVLKLAGRTLSEFGTVVLDEGHLLDSTSRGAAYELQLAKLKSQLEGQSRSIFLSAVLPNSQEIAAWLGGSIDALADDSWQPTTMRIGVVVWPENRSARLTYLSSTGQQLTDRFFVPRIVEEDSWREIFPETGHLRTYRFPRRGDGGSISAALAFKYAKDGPVVIFTSRPDWSESISEKILERLGLQREIATNLVDDRNRVQLHAISDYLRSILGDHCPLPRAVGKGFAYHHGGLPQSVRLVLEEEYRKQTIRLLIATNTLAQGVNLPIRTMIVHSLPQTDCPIRDFWNLAGRAGRALRESEGEVIILGTGNIGAATLGRFLDRGRIEPVESRILALVRELILNYQGVNAQALNALLENAESRGRFAATINALDAHLLELLAEDVAPDEQQNRMELLVNSLLASYQAEKADLAAGSAVRPEVTRLVALRAESVLGRVPDVGNRKRFSMSGLGIESCITAEASIDILIEALRDEQELDAELFGQIVDISCQCDELSGHDAAHIKQFGFQWLNLATYGAVFESAQEAFGSYGAVIRFVESVLGYRLPWVVNGLARLVEAKLQDVAEEERPVIPDWFTYLPQLVRYGVPSLQLMWIMSLGIPERRVAQWLLDRFVGDRNRQPIGFGDILDWAIETKGIVAEQMSREWPLYFSQLYERTIDRYERVRALLGE